MNAEGETASGVGTLCADSQIAVKSSWTLIAVGIVALAGLGLFWWQFFKLWSIWTTDSLRSIGALVIPTSAVLALRALHREDFDAGGSCGGLALIAAALTGAIFQYYGSTVLFWGLTGVDLMPFGLLL